MTPSAEISSTDVPLATTIHLPEFRRIKKVTNKIRDLEEEQRQMNVTEDRRREEIKLIAEQGSLSDEKIVRKLGNAQSTLDIIHYRRAALVKIIRELVAELSALVKSADKTWSALVYQRQLAFRKEHLEKFPPTGRDVKALQTDCSVVLTPADYDIGRLHAQLPDALPRDPYQLYMIAAQMIAHIEASAEKLGVTIEETEQAEAR